MEEDMEEVGSEAGGLRMVDAASMGTNDRSAGVLRDRLGDPRCILKGLLTLSSWFKSPPYFFMVMAL